ncbi:MAG TPA: hypothetical protein VKD71_11045, partial [Gemmataceae bacterium]|nr:hypothetical protein [Gemmataceae bacterium]
MPFAMLCPGCDTRFEFTSDLEGKRIKCKTCGDVFRVERPVRKSREADDDRPTGRSRRSLADDRDEAAPRRYRERDNDDRPRSKKIHPLVIIGPIAGALLLGAVITIILLARGGDKKKTGPTGTVADVVKAPAKTCPLEVAEKDTGFLVLPDSGGGFGLIRRKNSHPTRKDWVYEPYDLTTGRRVGKIDLVRVEEPKAWSLSPDGKHLLVIETKTFGNTEPSMHLVSTADGKDIDWVPFPKDSKRPFDSPSLYRAELVSNDRILALGTNRQMYFYRLSNLSEPEQGKVDSVGDPLGGRWTINQDLRNQWQTAFSADRKRMAVWNGDGYSIVDTAEGREVFRTPSVLVTAKELWPRNSVRREHLHGGPVAFSPDGSTLAGVVNYEFGGKQHLLCLWDTRAEKPPATYELPANQYNDATSLRWWGRKYILMSGAKVHGTELDGMLIDSRTGLPVRQLMAPPFKHYGLGRDGRLWYAIGAELKETATLNVVEGPD